MNKLNLIGIEEMVDKTQVSGICLLQTYSKQPTKNGSFYMGGTLTTNDGSMSFKSWGNSSAFRLMEEDDIKGCIVQVDAEVNVYNGMKSLIVSYIKILTNDMLNELGITPTDFMYSKYNVDAYFVKFDSLMEKNLSEGGMRVFNAVMDKYGERFKQEFASMHHHDNCRGGLLAHSLKVCQIASIVSLYPNILNWVSKDLLYLGCALHDIGKINEYNLGDISEEGKMLSHLITGALIIANEFEEVICNELGDRFFYDLISVISSHHGEFGEPPRTVAAYVVHKLDIVDSVLTSLNEVLEDAKKGDVQMFDGFKLS